MEILNTIQPSVSDFSIFIGIIFVIATIFFLIISIIGFKDKKFAPGITASVLSLFMVFSSYVMLAIPDDDFIKHEVIITDISKFDKSKYEIIEQRGEIFVVKELK